MKNSVRVLQTLQGWRKWSVSLIRHSVQGMGNTIKLLSHETPTLFFPKWAQNVAFRKGLFREFLLLKSSWRYFGNQGAAREGEFTIYQAIIHDLEGQSFFVSRGEVASVLLCGARIFQEASIVNFSATGNDSWLPHYTFLWLHCNISASFSIIKITANKLQLAPEGRGAGFWLKYRGLHSTSKARRLLMSPLPQLPSEVKINQVCAEQMCSEFDRDSQPFKSAVLLQSSLI